MNEAWKKFMVGSSHQVRVRADDIKDSDPCDKTNCMLTRAAMYLLLTMYGETFKVRSTNHGMILDIKGRRITFVFDTNTAKRIFIYDRTFTKTKSRSSAWASVKPFYAKLMVESNIVIPTPEPMSAETKALLAKRRKERGRTGKEYVPTREKHRRELSL